MIKSLWKRWVVRDLIRSWRDFRGFVLNCLGVSITREEEERFLALEARIASRLPALAETVPPSVPDAKEQFGRITDLLLRYRSLQAEAPLPPAEREEFERVWHQLFLFLNMLKSVPLHQAPAGPRPERMRRSGITGIPLHRMHRSIPGAGFLGFAARLGVFALFLFLLGRAFGIRFDAEQGLKTAGPLTAGGAARNVTDAVHSLTTGIGHFMQPVVSAYGNSLTYILVAVLLLGIGYWFFVRR